MVDNNKSVKQIVSVLDEVVVAFINAIKLMSEYFHQHDPVTGENIQFIRDENTVIPTDEISGQKLTFPIRGWPNHPEKPNQAGLSKLICELDELFLDFLLSN